MTTAQGLRDRHEGITANLAADTAPHRGYGEKVRQRIETLPRGTRFTADDIRSLMRRRSGSEFEPHHPNVLPSVFGVLAQAGVIRRVGEVNSTRRSRHGSRNAVWVRT